MQTELTIYVMRPRSTVGVDGNTVCIVLTSTTASLPAAVWSQYI